MTRAIFAIAVEVIALFAIGIGLFWASGRIDEQLAGATPAPVDTRKARTGAAAQESPLDGTTTPARAPLAFPEPVTWMAAFYIPHGGGYVVHQFQITHPVVAAHMAVFGMRPFPRQELRA